MNHSILRRARTTLSFLSLVSASLAVVALASGCGPEGDNASSLSDAEDLRWHHRDAGTTDSGTVVTVTEDAGTTTTPTADASTPPPATGRWMPKPGTSWQWQLSGTGTLDTSFNVQMYDIDLFDTSAATIASLHAAGRKVVCYYDTAYEPGRPDSATLYPYRGNAMVGWPGEYWLDVRVQAVVDVMKARNTLAQSKGCDAIEADDVDSVSNNPGTGVTSADQRAFIKALAADAQAKGMSFALKNDLEDVSVLLPYVDFAINEECFKYNECSSLTPFVTAGKAVFQVEYTSGTLSTLGATVCPKANALNFDTIIKHLDLDAPRYACR